MAIAVATAATLVVLPGASPAAPMPNGWPIYLVGNNEGHAKVYTGDGQFVRSFETFMNGGDPLAMGDVDGDGLEEMIVGGSENGGITVFQDTGEGSEPFGALMNEGDRLAAGDTDGDGIDEIIVAGDEDGRIELYNQFGKTLFEFDTNFDEHDYLAAADLDADGRDEIVMVGDGNGDAQMFTGTGEVFSGQFDTGYNSDDSVAVGDINGDGRAEILVAGDVSHVVDAFAFDSTPVAHIQTSYNEDDGFAAGDVDGNGVDDLVVAGDNSGDVEIFNPAGQRIGLLDGTGFDDDDFVVVGRSGDVDGDGLPNAVERFGVKRGDGTTVANLNANPCRPTVVVKADYMAADGTHRHKPDQSTMDRVVAAYHNALRPAVVRCPIPPYQATSGVQLILLPGTEIPHRAAFSNTKEAIVSDLKAAREQNLMPELAPYVHYMIWAHGLAATGENPSGMTPGFGKDFVIGLEDNTGSLGGPEGQAATFMHELGHSLGLRHGGFEDVNFKPNHISVMNYAFDTGLLPGQRLDYSLGTRPDLNQEHLDETKGIFDGNVETGYYNPLGFLRFGPGQGPIDWNDNGVDETDVNADVNGDNGGTCVGVGLDAVLQTSPAGDDVKAKPKAAGINKVTVIHAGPDYICDTEAAGDDSQVQDVGTDMRILKDHNDWAALDFRRPHVSDNNGTPVELSLAERVELQAARDNALYPERRLTFGAPPSGAFTGASAVAFDASRVYVTHSVHPIGNPHGQPSTGELVVLDRATLRQIRRIQVGHEPRSVAVNPVTNRIYVVNMGPDSYNVSVIDGGTLTVRAIVQIGQIPIDVAVNSRTNKVYVSNWAAERIEVIDGATDAKLAPIVVGPGPQGLTVDEATNTVIVALNNRSYAPNVNGVAFVAGSGLVRKLLIPGFTQPNDVAVDASRIYVGNLGAPGSPPGVMVFDRATSGLVADIRTTGVHTLGVDPGANLLLAGTDNGVAAIDLGSLTVVRSMPAGITPLTVAVGRGLGHEFYVGNREGELVRLSYSGGTPGATSSAEGAVVFLR